ncbi:DUF2637 domain-containing protein [Rhodococcoides fascians]|uniref:DUF2637 domain-containing protein n=1 Tax=Rhodococcoides fascians TaxID=1828 RepID=UPI00068A4DDC|nr:DUF2637 domain-containing protein [Rhodococcus fascians]
MKPAKRVAVTGIAILLPLALYLSYIALVDVAARSGVGHYEAYTWPIIVDGVAIVSTVAAYSLRGRKDTPPRSGYRYAWTLLAAAAIVSAAANAAHLLMPPGPMPQWVIAGVALVPPAAVVVVAHLAVILARDAHTVEPAAASTSAAAILERERGNPQVNTFAATPAAPEESAGVDAQTAPADTADDIEEREEADRAAEAARLRSEGLSLRKIGAQLGVSEKTIRRDLAATQNQSAA